MPVYPVPISYIDDVLRAEFDCPLCKRHVIAPFTGGGRPSPEDVVGQHIGGSGAAMQACGGVPAQGMVDVEKVGGQTAVIRVSA